MVYPPQLYRSIWMWAAGSVEACGRVATGRKEKKKRQKEGQKAGAPGPFAASVCRVIRLLLNETSSGAASWERRRQVYVES